LIEIWECQWDQLVKENPQITKFIKNEKDIRPDLKPRYALFGGRTNAALLYYGVKLIVKIMSVSRSISLIIVINKKNLTIAVNFSKKIMFVKVVFVLIVKNL
jgi:hypothetical protein